MALPVGLTPRAAIITDLRAGLGAEDISLNRGIPISTVRHIIHDLRDDGILANIQWNNPETVA